METRINKEALIEILAENRKNHQAIFDEAVEGYRTAAEEALAKEIERIRSGSIVRVYVVMPAPENHIADYDRALRMLELSEDEDLLMDENDVRQYVMDDWGWKGSFLAANATYSDMAKSQITY